MAILTSKIYVKKTKEGCTVITLTPINGLEADKLARDISKVYFEGAVHQLTDEDLEAGVTYDTVRKHISVNRKSKI